MISNLFSHRSPLGTTRRVLRCIALVVVLGAAVVACGDDGNSAAAPTSTTNSGTDGAPSTTTAPSATGSTGEAGPSATGSDGESGQSGDLVVVMDKVKYLTTELSVVRGAEVVFDNQDSQAHTATSDDQAFDTGLIEAGEMTTVTFDEAGTFAYHCSLHPFMKATVVVS